MDIKYIGYIELDIANTMPSSGLSRVDPRAID